MNSAQAIRLACIVLLLAVAASLATSPSGQHATSTPPSSRLGWPMFRGDPQLTGVAHGMLPPELCLRWKLETPEPISSSAAIVHGVVYVGGEDALLYALELATGKLKWKYNARGAIQSSPTVIDKTVFFGDQHGVLHACDAATGDLLWMFETGGEIISSVNGNAGRIVFGSYDGSLYCLQAKEGRQLWRYETDDRVHATPAIAEGYVLIAGCDAHLHVVRLEDGARVRRIRLGSVCGASAAVRGKRLFLGTYGSQVLGIDWSGGQVVWTYADSQREFPFLSSAAITDEAVVLGGRDKRLRALDPGSGKPRWQFVTKGRIDSSPVIVGQRVYVGSADGKLYAVDLETGKEVWQFDVGAPISASPAVAEGCLVIGSHDGVVRCFGLRQRDEP